MKLLEKEGKFSSSKQTEQNQDFQIETIWPLHESLEMTTKVQL